MTVSYLDHAATTPVRPEVVEAMVEVMSGPAGNPSGSHAAARAAMRRLDAARSAFAEVVGAHPNEVVFTGGGSEADNLAIRGVLGRSAPDRPAVCSALEHHAVLEPVEVSGGRTVAVTADGRIDLADLERVLDAVHPSVVSTMLVNNETGLVQPLDEVAQIVRDRHPDAVVHTDAVQALRWLDVATRTAVADLVSYAGHKFGGPAGVGALVVRNGVELDPIVRGGGQEQGRRSGTQNVAGIVGMSVAATLAAAERDAIVARVSGLRIRLVEGLRSRLDGWSETGSGERVAGMAHLCIDGVTAEPLLLLLEQGGVLASAASSCSSGAMHPSHVLAAMGYDRTRASGSLRLSIGPTTTEADIDRAVQVVPDAVERIRAAA